MKYVFSEEELRSFGITKNVFDDRITESDIFEIVEQLSSSGAIELPMQSGGLRFGVNAARREVELDILDLRMPEILQDLVSQTLVSQMGQMDLDSEECVGEEESILPDRDRELRQYSQFCFDSLSGVEDFAVKVQKVPSSLYKLGDSWILTLEEENFIDSWVVDEFCLKPVNLSKAVLDEQGILVVEGSAIRRIKEVASA